MDIHPVIDLPGVGRNLQDHLNVPVPYECIKPDLSFARYQRWDKTLSMGLEYLLKRSGPGAAPFWSVGAFKALDEDSLFPDYQVFFTPKVVVEEPSGSQMDYPSVSRGKGAIPGFQFDVTGVNITGVSGGSAEENGFLMSNSSSTVIGFSLTGATVPSGNAVLTVLEFEAAGMSACLANVDVSDDGGLPVEDESTGECVELDCGDTTNRILEKITQIFAYLGLGRRLPCRLRIRFFLFPLSNLAP